MGNGEVYGTIKLEVRRITKQTDECSAILESENEISEELVLEMIEGRLKELGIYINDVNIEWNKLFVDDESY